MRLSSRHTITPFLFFGEFVKGLSFSIEPSTLALGRGGDQRKRRPGLPSRLQHNDCFRGAQEPFFGRQSLFGGESPNEHRGVTTRRHGRHRALHASLPTTTAGLPSLAGLPSANNNNNNYNNNNAPPSPSNGSGGRSRRGKYPVIELYRRDPEGSTIADAAAGIDVGGCDDDDDDGLAGRRLPYGRRGEAGARRTAEPPATAVDHLRSVLGLASDQVDLMLESFPTLAHVDPDKLGLPAKIRFLRHTIGGEVRTVAVSFPQFFGHPLERLIAPRHAFLVANGRPSGERLLEAGCRGLRRMLELPVNRFVVEMVPSRGVSDYRRFEQAFLRGPFDAARKGDGETLRLLRSHGWDCWETDRRGRTALFWAAGGGSVEACEALVEGEGGLRPQDSGGDGSTPLHWAVAGVETRRFGTGGHVNVCRWLLNLGVDTKARTSEGNTVIMWAAWAGGLDATRWAVEEAGALDLDAANANGCTVAHWASSGGDEAVCRYLHSKGVDFTRRNKGGNDPLNHAVAYGRRNIAAWLLGEIHAERETPPPPPHRSSYSSVKLPGVGDGSEAAAAAAAAAGRRRRDDPHLLELARLTGDEKMQAFLLGVEDEFDP